MIFIQKRRVSASSVDYVIMLKNRDRGEGEIKENFFIFFINFPDQKDMERFYHG